MIKKSPFLSSKNKIKIPNKALINKTVATQTNPTTKNTLSKKISKTIKDITTEIAQKSSKNTTPSTYPAYASKEKISPLASISVKNLNSLKTINNKTIFKDINQHHLNERSTFTSLKNGDFLVKKDNNKIIFNSKRFSSYSLFGVYTRRIYAGFNLGIKKQGMITKLKKNSALRNFDQSIQFDFGSSFGGTIGFILSDNINIEANININSTSGYKRNFKAEEISYQENINLNYSTINLLAKKMNTKSTFDNKVYSTNFIGGIYASYLRSSFSDINEISSNTNNYNKTDYGVVLGIEQDRYITKTLVITPGIRYNQGIINTAASNSPFKSSRNFSLEFNLGVKYIFLKKGN